MRILRNTAARLLAGVLVFFLLATLVSCGTPQEDETVTPSPDTEDVETATPSPSTESDTPLGDSSKEPNSSTTELDPETEGVDTTDAEEETTGLEEDNAADEETDVDEREAENSDEPDSSTTGAEADENGNSSTPSNATGDATTSTPPDDGVGETGDSIETGAPEDDEIEDTGSAIPTGNRFTEEFLREVADWVVYYINQYRAEEDAAALTKLPGLTLLSEYRSNQLVTNYAHDTEDFREACAYYQYGVWHDMTKHGLDASQSYWATQCMEAIGCSSGYPSSNTAQQIGEKIATGFRNSSRHWAYIGSADYYYIGVGITYAPSSAFPWYFCIEVSRVNNG